MDTITDPVYLDARRYEDNLFEQRKFMEDQVEGYADSERFRLTAQASYSSLIRQERLEKAFGTPDWTAARLDAIRGNSRARKVLVDNLAAGIGGWDSGFGPSQPF